MVQSYDTLYDLNVQDGGELPLVLAATLTRSDGTQSRVWLGEEAAKQLTQRLGMRLGIFRRNAPENDFDSLRRSANLEWFFKDRPDLSEKDQDAIRASLCLAQLHAQSGRPAYRGTATLIADEPMRTLDRFDVHDIQLGQPTP